MQVYFLDNEDYFQRKYVFRDKENKFYADNDERFKNNTEKLLFHLKDITNRAAQFRTFPTSVTIAPPQR